MKEEKDKIRDLMHKVFDDYEVAPDPEDWNRIEKTLSEKKKRRYFLWAVWPVAASLLVLATLYTGGILKHTDNNAVRTAIHRNYPHNNAAPSAEKNALPSKDEWKAQTDKKQLATNKVPEKTDQDKVNATDASIIRKSNSLHGTKPNNKEAASPAEQIKKEASSERLIHKAKTAVTKNALLAANPNTQKLSNESFEITKTVRTVQAADSTNNLYSSNSLVHSIAPRPIESVYAVTKHDKSLDLIYKNDWSNSSIYLKNKFDLFAGILSHKKIESLSFSNSSGLVMQSSSKAMMSFDGLFASQLASNMYLNSVKTFDNSYLSSLNIGNLFQNKSHNYLPPVTFGLNINLSLQNQISRQGHWSIETGIQYTRLQSRGVVSINSSSAVQFSTSFGYKVDENLYYLGVPVIINYNFNNFHKTSFYISTGFSVEKGIIAKYKATPEDNFPGMESIYSHNGIKGLQYSLNSGFGINYKLIRHLELFFQPSMAHYFSSQGQNTTIYSVHPWLFNLRSGFRFTIKY